MVMQSEYWRVARHSVVCFHFIRQQYRQDKKLYSVLCFMRHKTNKGVDKQTTTSLKMQGIVHKLIFPGSLFIRVMPPWGTKQLSKIHGTDWKLIWCMGTGRNVWNTSVSNFKGLFWTVIYLEIFVECDGKSWSRGWNDLIF